MTQNVTAGDTIDWVGSGAYGGGNTPLSATLSHQSDGFQTSNTAAFGANFSNGNGDQGYRIQGTPATGSGTNTGSGNGSNDSF